MQISIETHIGTITTRPRRGFWAPKNAGDQRKLRKSCTKYRVRACFLRGWLLFQIRKQAIPIKT
jgi:hypothetical protein